MGMLVQHKLAAVFSCLQFPGLFQMGTTKEAVTVLRTCSLKNSLEVTCHKLVSQVHKTRRNTAARARNYT